MDLSDPADREHWRSHLSELLDGREVICGVAPLAGLTDLVAHLAHAGAQKPLLVRSTRA